MTNSSGLEMSEELLRRYMSGGLNTQEQHFVERNLLDSELWSDVYEGLQAMEADSVDYSAVQPSLASRLDTRIEEEKPKRPAIPLKRWMSGVAAVFFMVAVLAGSMKYFNSQISDSATAQAQPNFTIDDDAIEVIQLRDYSIENRVKVNTLPVKLVDNAALPEELQYSEARVDRQVAAGKQLPSGKTEVKLATIDQESLRYNGYRVITDYTPSSWQAARGPNPPEPPVQRRVYSTQDATNTIELAAENTIANEPGFVYSTPIESTPPIAAAPIPSSDHTEETVVADLDEYTDVEAPAGASSADQEAVVSASQPEEEEADFDYDRLEARQELKRKKLQKSSRSEGLSTEVIIPNTISGTITAPDGEPLIGATVRISGTDNAVVTDMNGDYTLTGVEEGDEVTISYVGMNTITAEARLNDENYFVLESNPDALSEVVISGYGKAGSKESPKKTLEDYLEQEAQRFQQLQSVYKTGKVVLEVELNENGTVSATKVIKGLSTVYDIEAERLVKQAAQKGYFNNWAATNKAIRVRIRFK